jgi:energy-coupling factor transporter ATP-binding protein EcfA2
VRILSVTLKNVRMHAELTVTFDRERTVVVGPNESGKSTLVDAIERVLCYPHRSTADSLDGLKPRAGGGAPEVSLEFERQGRTYVIHKVFKGAQSLARLTAPDGVVSTGDDAEEKLRALLGFGETRLRDPFCGWSHLWARQGEAGLDPTDGAALGDAAKELDARLKRLTGTIATESKKDAATGERIAAECDATFTQTGAVRAPSPLGVATAELKAAREAAAQAAAVFSELEAAADTVVREDALIQEGKAALADAERRLGEICGTLAEIDSLEKTLAVQKAAAAAAAKDHATLDEGHAKIEKLSDSTKTRTEALAPREREIERLLRHEQQLQAAVAGCLAAIDNANDAQRHVAAEEDLLRAVARVFEREAARGALEANLERIKSHEAAIAAINERLARLPDVDEATVGELESLDRQLEVGQGKLAASATRLEVLRAGVAVAVDGRPLAVGESRLLTDAAEVAIGDGTTIRVNPGGGESILELRAEVGRIRQALASGLRGLGLKTVAEARTTLDARLADEAARERLQEKIDALDGDGVRERLDGLAADLRKVEAEIDRKKPAGFERPADAAAVALALRVSEERRSEADAAVRTARARFESSRQDLANTQRTREEREAELSAERRELQELHVHKAGLEQVHGTDRKARLESLAAGLAAKEKLAAATERTLVALAPDRVRMEKERYENTVKVITDAINAASVRRARAEADLLRGGTMHPHNAKAAADARHEIARRRHAEIDQRAQAVRRLRDLFEKRRQEMADLVAAPLCAKVRDYLDSLFGPGSQVAIKKAGEKFEDLAVARPSVGGFQFDFDVLSGGTREQVAAAWRLAMAEVLAAGDDGDAAADACLPMVFDDAFVNSDPERIEAVQRVLYLASRRGLQIIVLSCNPQEYANFAAKRIDLPRPKHAASDVSAAAAIPAASQPADKVAAADDAADNSDSAGPTALPGQRPAGDDDALSAEFLSLLAGTPDRRSGNVSFRNQLGWDEETYERIKDRLIAVGRIEKGKGRGGSIRLIDGGDPAV